MTTTPPNNGPGREDGDDPTGMRDLLRSLPDPGPMPDTLARSISDALEREQAERAAHSPDRSNVTPLTSRKGAGRWQRAVISLGAAAAVAAVAVVGVTAIQDRHAPTTAAPSAQASQQSLEDKVVVESTGSDYTKQGLATQAAAMTRQTGPTLSPAQVQKIGSIATRQGVVACMQSIGAGLLDDPDKINVDIASYEGTPAAIVVITKGSTSTAWVVSRSCAKGEPPLAGPTSVTT